MLPRFCAKCNESIPIDHGFYFDEKLNIFHNKCNCKIFNTTPSNVTLTIPNQNPTNCYKNGVLQAQITNPEWFRRTEQMPSRVDL